MSDIDQKRERYLRGLANRHGYRIQKRHGGYALVITNINALVFACSNYSFSLDDVEEFVAANRCE